MKTITGFNLRSLLLAAAFLAGLGGATYASAQPNRAYLIDLDSRTATDLGTLGGTFSFAYGINATGQVVGVSSTAKGDSHAFITGPNGVGMRDLGTVGGRYSFGYGINDAGQVVGFSHTADDSYHAFITGPNGVGMTILGTLGGPESHAFAINGTMQVVGRADTAESSPHAFITGPDGAGMRDLGTLGGPGSHASGINDAGQVVGNSDTAYRGFRAFITGPNGVDMTDLGTLGGAHSAATGINDTGQVVGYSEFSPLDDYHDHAFITGPNGVDMTDLGTLGGPGYDSYNYSHAAGINDAGQVVGWSYLSDGSRHAFITGPNGAGMSDLNSLVNLPAGMVLIDATGINNSGQVLASGAPGEYIPPVPEPESYALLLAGLALIAVVARRKKGIWSACSVRGRSEAVFPPALYFC